MANCPNCGNQTGEGAVFCDQCGARIPAPEPVAPEPTPAPAGGSVICGACGAGNVPGEAFCDYCGSPLDAPVPTAEAVPELEPVSSEEELAAELEPEVEEAPAAEEPAAAAPVAAVPAAGASVCPACGEEAKADEAFCANCGASLAAAPLPPEPVAEVEAEPVAPPPAPEPAPEPVPEPAPEPVPEPAPDPAPEPVVEAAPSPPPPPPPPPPAPALTACPACGTEVEPGDTFCSSCGAVLQEPPASAPVEAAPPRLVVAASGAEIPLPADAEILVGREDPVSGIYPGVDLTPHGGEEGGVSRRHARLIVEGGNYFVEDLDSTNFTFVNKQKIAPKTRQSLNDGDEIRCGRVALILKTG